MKKYLIIFSFLLSSFIYSQEVSFDSDYSEYLQSIKDALYNEESDVNEDGTEEIYERSIAYYLWNLSSNSDISTFETLPELYNYLCANFHYFLEIFEDIRSYVPYLDKLDFIPSIFYHLSDNWQDISNGFAQNHADVVSIRTAIHDLEMKQEGYLSGICGNVENIGNGLTEIIDILRNQNGSSESDFPKEEIGYYQLENYGKNVSINHLPFQSLETTGEYNKDVHRMLLTLTRLGSSHNNAALSILTNVQVIATALSQDAKGQDKLEKDLEDKEYQATKAEAELSGITSQNWDSSFTPPRYLSEVNGRLSIGLSDPGLPSEITVMDKFYYETTYFSLEIDPLSFNIPQPLVDLANYGRIVFGFIYWSLTFFLALYLFRLWIKLYMYVSNTLINR